MSVSLEHKVFKFLEDERSEGRQVLNQFLSVCNILMLLRKHLGMALEKGGVIAR